MSDEFAAIDYDGKAAPLSDDEVQAHLEAMVREGHVLAVVLKHGDELGVQCFVPPSVELFLALKNAAIACGRALANARPDTDGH